jgi:hypothetical protein
MTFADGMVRRASVRQRATLGRRHKERAHSGLQQVANGITFRDQMAVAAGNRSRLRLIET